MDVLIDDLIALGFNDPGLNLRSFDVRNVKLFEKIIHFLITFISPESIQTWPVMYRNDELPFRKEVVNYFKSLNHESLSATEVSVLLPNSCGPKCVDFLLRFVQYVMEQKIAQIEPDFVVPVAQGAAQSPVVTEKLKILSNHSEKELMSSIGFYQSEQKKLEIFYQQLIADQKRLIKVLDSSKKAALKKGTGGESVELNVEELERMNDNMVECRSMMSQMQAYQQSIQFTLNKQSKAAEVGRNEQQGLSSVDLNVQVPTALTSCLDHDQSRMICEQPLFEAGQLNLITLAKLSNHSIDVYNQEKPRVLVPRSDHYSGFNSLNSVEDLQKLKEQLDQLSISVDTQMSVLSSKLSNR